MKGYIGFMAFLACASWAQADYSWQNVQIRGGGYVPGVTFHPAEKDLVYVRTDVGGAYKLGTGLKSWIPLNDMFTDGNDMGSVAIAVDADNGDYVYSTGGLYTDVAWCGGASFLRSSDRGAGWTRIPLNSTTVKGYATGKVNGKNALCLAGNGTGRGMGNRIAAKGEVIYLATNQNGLLKSTDRGSTWTTVSKFSNTAGVGAVAFDAAGNIYAAPDAGGLYLSADGSSWTAVGGLSAVVYQMSYSPKDNTLWMTTNSGGVQDQNNPSGGKVYKYAIEGGKLSEVSMPAKGGKDYGYVGISVNPSDAQQVVVSTGGWWKGNGGPIDGASFVPHEAVFMTRDGGSSWIDLLANGSFDTEEAYNAASSNPHWISALAVDPFDEDHVIFGTGYGVWSTFDATAAKPTWYFTDTGIEETVPLALASTPFGAPLVSALGDVDGFYHEDLDVPPLKRHKAEDGKYEAGTNYQLDWATQHPQFVVRVHKQASRHLGGYSLDGGKTWKDFGSHPPFVASQYSSDGTYSNEDNFIALSADASSMVWNMNGKGIYYSLDSGKVWTFAANTSSLAGFRVVSDRKKAGTYYLYNAGTGALWRSSDHGVKWTAVNTSLAKVDSWAYGYMRVFASPDAEGELWATQGAHLNTSDASLTHYKGDGMWVGNGKVWRSTNGGETFREVPGLLYGISVGFGKGKTDGVSAVYVVGIDNTGLQGLFRSENQGASWTRINDDAHSYGGFAMVVGDPCIYSRVYLTGAARGIIYGQEAGYKNTCTDRLDNGEVSTPVLGKTLAESGLVRVGASLWGKEAIRLYTMDGRLVASATVQGGSSELSMQGIARGLYLARSGSASLRVNWMH